MNLTALNPRWLGAGGDGVFQRTSDGDLVPVPPRHGVGISFDCPCGRDDHDGGHTRRVVVEFTQPLDGGPPYRTDGHTWQRSGDTFETLTLSPSIQRIGGCAWHGWIRNGEVIQC